MASSATDVASSSALVIVLFTCSATELGFIHRLVASQSKGKTPFQTNLDEFGTTFSKLIGYMCVIVFAIRMKH